MKVIELISENFKRLNAHVVMDGKSVTIEGKNGVGKSTFIDAIWVALTGKETPGKPIKDGKDSAKISVKVKSDDGSVFIVEKKFSTSGGTLTVKTPEGAKFSSPQKFLDEKIGKISFDPFEFVHKQPREQKKFLMELLGIDLEDIDKLKKNLLSQKDDLFKQYQNIKGELDKSPVIGEPLEERNIDEAFNKLQSLNLKISEIKSNQVKFNNLQNEKNRISSKAKEVEHQIKELKNQMAFLNCEYERISVEISSFGDNPAFELPELSDIQTEINEINEHNQRVKLQKENKLKSEQLIDHLNSLTEKGKDKVKEIKLLEKKRVEVISTAKMPIEGLSFGEDGLLFDGLPFAEDQLSTAKLIETGIKISMALNPTLRIMRIKDGSLLDSETLEIIKSAAKDNDYQLFIERVSDSSEIGFIIEEDSNNAN